MASEEEVGVSRKRRRKVVQETGPYILRTLVDNVPLGPEGDAPDIEISCVELWEGNLYIGTSAGDILHLVLIPPDPTETAASPTYILASRLQPAFVPSTLSGQKPPGIQQILVLPRSNKACVLCNGMLTFYSLPELSPAFATTKVANCAWVGGVDQNAYDGGAGGDGEVVMISIRSKIRLVHIGEQIRVVKNIDYAGSLFSARRDAFACVADAHSYALLDVDHQQKIPLFPISSLDETVEAGTGGQAVSISSSGPSGTGATLSDRPLSADPTGDNRGHGRSTSLGAFVSGLGRRQESPRPRSSDRSRLQTPEPHERESSPARESSPDVTGERRSSPSKVPSTPEKPLPQVPTQEPSSTRTQLQKPAIFLRPHILSPSPGEFLLTTGTASSEPGVGMFVNLDGDVVRGTVEFAKYPDSLAVDGRGVGIDISPNNADDEEGGYVLAVIERNVGKGREWGLECQRWDVDPGEPNEKEWLQVTAAEDDRESNHESESSLHSSLGIRTTLSYGEIPLAEVCAKLQQRRIRLTQSSASAREFPLEQWEIERSNEEEEFARRFGRLRSRVAVWSGSKVWWAVRSPLAIRLDAQLELARMATSGTNSNATLDRRKVVSVVNDVRGKEPRTETEFLSLNYIRQKAGLLLFMELIGSIDQGVTMENSDKSATEDAMMEGGVDPRIILALIPFLRQEIVEGSSGIWIFGGVKEVAEKLIMQQMATPDSGATTVTPEAGILDLIRRYLLAWRRKKGFGSIADEGEVFRTVDAALLRVLLRLDLQSPKGPATPSSIRAELNGFIDHGVACFDRAVELLEAARRLYILSRLYQSRKLARDVLATWRRILEGEIDEGGEFDDGENKVREYLIKSRDPVLVEEFGTWLARRNPKIGVRVFADDNSRIKLNPSQVVKLLQKGAPDAVKEYLEHLVFGKNNTQYVNELIFFYLDSVLAILKDSETARSTLAQTYESYRALRPPKPTYRQFITDNVIDEEWWQNRLRLLQLLGGNRGAASDYNVEAILQRIEPYEQELVPEMIILHGRQARHPQAIRLLTHGLGDFDTAINYCLMGGSSIFHPMSSGHMRPNTVPTRQEQATLFSYLLAEFMRIEDLTDRIERSSELLERFGGWLDVAQVLSLIPDSWSVELVSGFLISALRRLVREKNMSMVAKALSGAENLRISADFIARCEEVGPTVEAKE
ncbi:MAG: hypothetical protein M1812_007523 [Candelaria pacifica]|nr:MAG: hypothetical protein M1812_007523 [Candelaria pacifica]